MALVIDTTQPAHRVVSSVEVSSREDHDFVTVYNRGCRAGILVVQKGDGPEVARRLMPPGTEECSLCRKTRREVRHLVATKSGDASVCNECVTVAVGMLLETKPRGT